jgi:multidrug efflux pump subunit AcrB
MKGGFNLSRWALEHIPLVRYLMVVLLLGGLLSYTRLGQDEDPPFTFRAMVVRAYWPGATSLQMADQVTDKLEKKLQETPYIDRISSYSKPGETLIILNLRESTPPREVQNAWYQVRKKIGDIRNTLPGDGFTYAEVKDYADFVRQQLLKVPSVSKVEQYGVQDEKIYIEFSHKRFSQLGVPFETVVAQINAQNAVESTGVLVTPSDNLQVRVSGALRSVADLENLQLRANGSNFRLGDFATVRRGFRDPPQDKMRFNGQEVIGLGISMERGGNIIELGENLQKATAEIRAKLPVGIELKQVTNQPEAVASSVNEFVHTLIEAVYQAPAVGCAARPGRGADHSAGAGRDLPVHARFRHRPAQDFAWRADHCAGTTG